MNHDFLKGTGVALVTPFNADKTIDYPGLERLIDYVISEGVNYLVALGTTGEPPTLNREEKKMVFEFILEINQGRVPVVAGIGGNNTAELIDILNDFNATGFSAVLSASPYYNKPSQEGIFQHYKAIADSSPLPVIIYNVPVRTGSNITAETSLRLAHQVKNLCGIKEASGNFEQFNEILRGRPDGFLLLSGDDGIALPMLALGAEGLISVAANALPGQISRLVQAALDGNMARARSLHHECSEILSLLFKEGNPAGVKSMLHTLGICQNVVRLPLVHASSQLEAEISKHASLAKRYHGETLKNPAV